VREGRGSPSTTSGSAAADTVSGNFFGSNVRSPAELA
jgi:hypothetical protein